MTRRTTRAALALAALAAVLAARPAQADTIYTDQASFLAATLPGYYLETFDSLSTGVVASPIGFSDGTFSYDASSTSGNFFNLSDPGDPADIWLSTDFATDVITFTMLTPDVTSIGGFFFVTDFFGTPIDGTITAELDNGTFLSVVTSSSTNFIGFTTTAAIVSLTVSADNSLINSWPTVNDLIVGRVVPEPGSLALCLAGLAVGGLVARRHRARAAA